MKKLNAREIDQLLAGDSWFSTGGGFPRDRAKVIFKKILKRHKLILKGLDEFGNDDYLCVASGVGSIKHTNVDITRESSKGIMILEELIGKKIKGIVSGEIGLECLAADSAAKMGLPIVDADMKGGRAAPEPSINMFNLQKQPVLPAVAINTSGDIAVLKEVNNQQKIETFLRHFANMAEGCFVAWCPRPAGLYKKLLVPGTIGRAMELGKMILGGERLKTLLKMVKGKIIFEGRVSKILDENLKGFLLRKMVIKNKDNQCEIWIKNENLVAIIDGKIKMACPDLISVVDPSTNLGLHNSKIKTEQRVVVLGIRHHKRWHTKRGYEIFGPKHFNL